MRYGNGYYCVTHKHPHLEFDDGTHACTDCVEQRVRALTIETAERYALEIRRHISTEEILQLVAWDILSSRSTGTRPLLTILRAIVLYAQRHAISEEQVMRQIVEQKSVTIINPALRVK